MPNLTSAQILTLKDEVGNNPKSIPDLSWSQSDIWIRDKLNTPGISSEVIGETSNVDMNLIMAQFVKSEIDTLSTNQAILLSGMIAREGINPVGGLNLIKSIFGPGTTTRSNLEALGQRPASRIEKLFGMGITLSEEDVHRARRA